MTSERDDTPPGWLAGILHRSARRQHMAYHGGFRGPWA